MLPVAAWKDSGLLGTTRSMQSDEKLLDCSRPAADNQKSQSSGKGTVHSLECVTHGSQPMVTPRSEVLVNAGKSFAKNNFHV